MKDFLVVFLTTTTLGVLLASFIHYIFYLATWGHGTIFTGIVVLFAVIGIILGTIADYLELPSSWFGD